MKTLTIFKTLGPIDLKNVRRDSLLLWLPLIPIIQALGIRGGVPIVAAALQQHLGFDLTPYYPLIMGAFVLESPITTGVIGVTTTLIGFPIAGLTPLPFGHLLVVALLGSLIGPQVALFLAAFAENKVAGFALFKFLNSLLFIPIVAFFLPGNWQLLAGFLSPFWPLKVFWLAAQGQSYWLFLLAGLLVNLITLMLLLQRFQKVVHR
ncbi:MAG: hypothetical protein E6J22_17545 [Chloroflexi bacterium]|nr:MAG: hypothetical protein E6J22_17545 [Chloroflexota bacterium]